MGKAMIKNLSFKKKALAKKHYTFLIFLRILNLSLLFEYSPFLFMKDLITNTFLKVKIIRKSKIGTNIMNNNTVYLHERIYE